MSWFRRRRCRYVRPSNPDWTPDEGERIELAYAAEIEAWEIATDRYCTDYSAEQWGRYLAVAGGITPERAVFALVLVLSGRIGRGDTSADGREGR